MSSPADDVHVRPPQTLSINILQDQYGVREVLRPPGRGGVVASALMLPRVAIIDMSADQIEATVGRGHVWDRYAFGICIVDTGAMTYRNAQGKATAGPGAAMLIGIDTDGDPGTYEYSTGFHGLWILASERIATMPLSTRFVPIVSPLGSSFVALLSALVANANQPEQDQSPAAIDTTEDIVSYVFSNLVSRRWDSRFSSDKLDHGNVITSALTLIAQSAHQAETTPLSIATSMHVSLGYLHRVFKSHVRTVAEEIRHYRTQMAIDALVDRRTRSISIDSIATSAGFSSTRTMRRAVTEATGLSPNALRSSTRTSRVN